MTLDINTIKNIAFLARIKAPEDEWASLAAELSQILSWVEQLNEVNTDGVLPMANVAGVAMSKRADQVTDGGDPESVLANAPDRENGFFAVPKVIE